MRFPIPNIAPPDDFLIFIGYICAWWQQIEHFTERTIWHWAGLSDKRGRCITHHMPFPLRCDVLRSLADARFKNAVYNKALHKFVESHLKTAQTVRNRFAHALWLHSGDGEIIVEKPSRTSHQIEVIKLDERELILAAAKIAATFAGLLYLIGDFENASFEPDAWQKKLRELRPLYDQLIAEQSRYRAMRDKRPRPPRSSRAKS